MAEQKAIIWGHTVSHDESVASGMYFLSRQINAQEAQVFFEHAYNHGSAVFQDHAGYRFKLVHEGGEYNLIKS